MHSSELIFRICIFFAMIFHFTNICFSPLITNNYLASGKVDGHQVALGGLNFSLHKALFFVWNPASLLAIVGLALVDTFLFERNEQVWGRIGVLTLLLLWLRHFGGAYETFGLVETRERSPGVFLSKTLHVRRPFLHLPERETEAPCVYLWLKPE